ncbi:hypothetical protein CHU98_g8532 [Xylaria longipes]|nr:hypothetical protein CHU98_g8532 [Xylaria longipes]
MSSSGRTPLPEWRPKLAAINANIVAGLKQSKRKPVPCKRPTPVENEEIDHTQVPVVALADGVVQRDLGVLETDCTQSNSMRQVWKDLQQQGNAAPA